MRNDRSSLISIHSHESGTVLPPHKHDAAHLIVVLAGEFADISGGVTRWCEPSAVLLRPSGVEHENHFGARPAKYLRMVIAADTNQSLPAETIVTRNADAARIEGLLGRSRSHRVGVIGNLLTAILRRALRDWRLNRARSLIAERAGESPRIASIASEVGLDPLDLARSFRNVYGETPSQFRAAERLARACEELRQSPRRPLSEIALVCGYYDQSHMTRTFRRLLRTTPSRYASRS